ncbi:MAG: hypothetical protein J0G37_09260 [Afipia sp.]|nr:hypothetical protein [Afipia sp.]
MGSRRAFSDHGWLIQAVLQVAVLQVMDVSPHPWHSRWMRHRRAPRQFLVALLLSQAMAVQGLLLAWSGALAVTDVVTGTICSAVTATDSHGAADGQEPAQPSAHHDCLSACVAGHAAGMAGPAELSRRVAVSLQPSRPSNATLPPLSEVHGFLARAPPVLIEAVHFRIPTQHHSRTT